MRAKAKDHLISMLFCIFGKCSSLREVSGAMLGPSGKTEHFKLGHIPYRSTLSDTNKRRSAGLFADVYRELLKEYQHFISDSRVKDVIKKQIEIFDSTTISLFRDIMKCVGSPPVNGKQKGGIKMHTVINVDEIIPKMVWFVDAATSDHKLLGKLNPDKDTIYVFDKGYNDYKAFWFNHRIQAGSVTRIKDNACYEIKEERHIGKRIHSGVLEDVIIEVEEKEGNAKSKLSLRKVQFYDRVLKREFEFLTNLLICART